MGILDEAIKEHLDLKRQHGAEDSEVKRLEDEAFGPPTRPGEPDFPESQEQPVVADAPDGEVSEGEGVGEAAGEPEAATSLMQPETAPATPAESPPEEEAAPTEPATEEGAEDAPAPSDDEAHGFFDREAEALDLDLDLGDQGGEDLVTDAGVVEAEAEEAHKAEPEAPSEEQPADTDAPPEEPPVANLETVEHPMEEELGMEPPSEEHPAAEDEPEPESEEREEEDEGTGEGDVLEETPEFLQDRPEDDELWFEQGQPKDFDF
jgi:hypothetical protein